MEGLSFGFIIKGLNRTKNQGDFTGSKLIKSYDLHTNILHDKNMNHVNFFILIPRTIRNKQRISIFA